MFGDLSTAQTEDNNSENLYPDNFEFKTYCEPFIWQFNEYLYL